MMSIFLVISPFLCVRGFEGDLTNLLVFGSGFGVGLVGLGEEMESGSRGGEEVGGGVCENA